MMEEAPIDLMPPDTKQRAYDVAERARQNSVIQNVVPAILLYTWLLQASQTLHNTARLQNDLGIAYRNLPTGDRGENLRQAITCYDQALLVRTREAAPLDWAATQNNLGNAYAGLPTGDRGDNLRLAIACYEQALEFFTSMHVDHYAQVVKRNLEIAQQELQDLEQE
ncbi:MAG TPA: hypothetical protein DHW02_12000 [Ktedonobacter sp.]|nr:hypothetical protein [Ktedonobacter sp.]